VSFQSSIDLLAKIMESFQKTLGEHRKAHHNAFAVITCSVFPGTADGGLFHWRWNFNEGLNILASRDCKKKLVEERQPY